MVNNVKVLSFLSYKVLFNDDALQYKFFKHSKKTMKIIILATILMLMSKNTKISAFCK